MKVLAELTVLLVNEGFDVEADGEVLRVTRDGMVNPADVRQRIAQTFSERGYEAYYLKEVYAYMGSKKPWRTDQEAYVEVSLWDSFAKRERPGFMSSARQEPEALPLLSQIKKKKKKSA